MTETSISAGMSDADLAILLNNADVEAVDFIQDYVTVQFSCGSLICVTDPVVHANGRTAMFPEEGSRDALCSLINQRVMVASVREGDGIRLSFSSGARLDIPFKATPAHHEAATFSPSRVNDNRLWVFYSVSERVVKLAQPTVEEDEQRAVIEALQSGQLAQGPRVLAFEQAFASHAGVRHAVAVNSGTAALHVALLAHGIGPNAGGSADDEVIVPAFSFAATATCVLQAGAKPVFLDVREDSFGIDFDAIERVITPRTRAVIAVHLYGLPCEIEAVAAICGRRNLVLIEDAAQAVGATFGERPVGSFGTATYSFYATKNLFTGEGGMITTSDEGVAERARMSRSQGERTRYVTEELGYNYRMTEPAAALGIAQLPKLAERNEQRRKNAARLSELLARAEGLVLPCELPRRTHVWHQYTVRVTAGRDARDALQGALRERGIESAVFYPIPIHRQPLYRRLGYGEAELPVAQRLADEVLSLPVHPGLSEADVETIASAVREAMHLR